MCQLSFIARALQLISFVLVYMGRCSFFALVSLRKGLPNVKAVLMVAWDTIVSGTGWMPEERLPVTGMPVQRRSNGSQWNLKPTSYPGTWILMVYCEIDVDPSDLIKVTGCFWCSREVQLV